MANYMIVRHKVRDFKKWKSVYDADRSKRVEAGLSEKQLLHGADNPNEVVLLFEANDLKRAKEFGSSAGLNQKMEEGGVIDKPTMYFLHS